MPAWPACAATRSPSGRSAGRTLGLTLLAATPPRRYDIRYIGQWQERVCREQGVEFVLNKTATVENILAAVKEEGYDRVVLACGSEALTPMFPVEEGANVVQAWDVSRATPRSASRSS